MSDVFSLDLSTAATRAPFGVPGFGGRYFGLGSAPTFRGFRLMPRLFEVSGSAVSAVLRSDLPNFAGLTELVSLCLTKLSMRARWHGVKAHG
jgi:hypothetical protein